MPTKGLPRPELMHELLQEATKSADRFDELRGKYAALLASHKQLRHLLKHSETTFFYIRNLAKNLWLDRENLEAMCRCIETFAETNRAEIEEALAKAKEIINGK